MINKRQAILLILLCTLSTKLERLPNIVSVMARQDGWLVLLICGFIDCLMLLVAIWFFNRHNNKKEGAFEVLKFGAGNFFARFLYFFVAVYFMAKTVLPFEAVRELFASVLFDKVNYVYFGILFVAVTIFVVNRGIRTIGREAEIYMPLVFIGAVGIVILGITSANFSRLLPLFTTRPNVIIEEVLKCSPWFGDYLILFIISGMVDMKKGDKIGASLFFSYFCVVCLIVPLCVAIFYSLYGEAVGYQTNAISSITQFSLLEFDIGRVDYFLVLFEQLSVIISASAYLYFAAFCFCKSLGIKKLVWVAIAVGTINYLLDVFLFRNTSSSVLGFREFLYIFMLIINFAVPLIFIVCSLKIGCKKKAKNG